MNGERLIVNRGGGGGPVYRLLFTVHALLCLLPHPVAAQIQDNSFLLEEAYNQESGVVQHISAFSRSRGGDWTYTFTQEWPLGGIRHQLSYTIPVERTSDNGAGLGDIGVNYRHQLLGNPEATTVAAARLSLLLPTGDENSGRGAGGIGLQANLPITVMLGPRWATHWNAGSTLTPTARNGLGAEETTVSFNLGASAIWLLRPSFNLLVEALWLSTDVVGTGREEAAFLNPGVRLALDVGSLQIVPGAGYTIGLNDAAGDDALFLYLSLEHPFQRQ